MEAITIKRISQKAGRHPEGGKAQRGIERVRTGSVPGIASITLGRFHTVDLIPKLGVYVYGKLQIMDEPGYGENIRQIYDDLWPCYVAYHKLYHGCEPTRNYIESSGMEDAFAMMLALLSQMMGNYAQIDIVHDYYRVNGCEPNYYFVAYQECFHVEEWHVLELGPTIKKLMRWYPADLKIFLLFLHAFDAVNIDTWYQGHMDYILQDRLPEEIMELEASEPKEAAQIQKTIDMYESGLPWEVHQMIKTSFTHINENGMADVNLDLLEIYIDQVVNEPIRVIITEGLKVLRMRKCINEYSYVPEEYEDHMGLTFDNQFTMLWDISDLLSGNYEEDLNAIASEGIFVPYQHLAIKPDCDRLFIPDQFTRVLTSFFDVAVDQMRLFTKPKKKKDARNIK